MYPSRPSDAGASPAVGSTGAPPTAMPANGFAATGLIGLVTLSVGTFLPWLQSGAVARNSYTSAGLLERLLGVHGRAATALDLWPFLGMTCALVVLGFLVGLRRTAAVAAFAIGTIAASVALLTLRTTGVAGLRHATVGPAVTAIGSLVTIAAVTLFLVSLRAHTRHVHGRTS